MTKSKTASKKAIAPAKKATLNWPSKLKTADNYKVAEKTGFSTSHVFNVAAGRRYNAEIINAFNSLTARRK